MLVDDVMIRSNVVETGLNGKCTYIPICFSIKSLIFFEAAGDDTWIHLSNGTSRLIDIKFEEFIKCLEKIQMFSQL